MKERQIIYSKKINVNFLIYSGRDYHVFWREDFSVLQSKISCMLTHSIKFLHDAY